MDIGYVFKKIWYLIALLAVSAVIVWGDFTSVRLFPLFDAYYRFALYVIITGIAASLLPKVFPEKFNTETGFFACHRWENNGKFYHRVFHVTKWKNRVMEASKIFRKPSAEPAGTEKAKADQQLSMKDPETVNQLLKQTCISELSHWILILVSPSLLFILRNRLRWLFLVLYISDNLKDIIIQRYNRPRLKRLAAVVNPQKRPKRGTIR